MTEEHGAFGDLDGLDLSSVDEWGTLSFEDLYARLMTEANTVPGSLVPAQPIPIESPMAANSAEELVLIGNSTLCEYDAEEVNAILNAILPEDTLDFDTSSNVDTFQTPPPTPNKKRGFKTPTSSQASSRTALVQLGFDINASSTQSINSSYVNATTNSVSPLTKKTTQQKFRASMISPRPTTNRLNNSTPHCRRNRCTHPVYVNGFCARHVKSKICRQKGCTNIQRSMELCARHRDELRRRSKLAGLSL